MNFEDDDETTQAVVSFRLMPRQDSIEVMDGPYKGKKYERGKVYTDIPPEEAWRFEEV